MRITGGAAARRILKVPKGLDVRPTPDLVKQAVFNSLDDQQLPKLLAAGGRWVLGHTKRDTLDIPPGWDEVKMLKHGDTLMRFFERKCSTMETLKA
jgi:16S rRNA G966 N2-methylase RsmD